MDDRFRPYFFVRAADRDALHRVAPDSRVSRGRAAHLRGRAGAPGGGRSPGGCPAAPGAARRGRRRVLRGRRPICVSLPDRPRDPRRLPRGWPLRAPSGRRPRVPEPAPRARGLRAAAQDPLARHRDQPRRALPLLDRGGRPRRRPRVGGPLRGIGAARRPPRDGDRPAGAERASVPPGLPRPSPRDGSRRPHGLEHRRLRRDGPPARGAAGPAPAGARPDGGGGRGAARPRLHPGSAGDPLGAPSAGRPGAPPQRLREARRLPARHRRAGDPRQGEALLRRAPRPRDRDGVAGGSGAPRRVQPQRRAPRGRDPRAHGAGRADGPAEPPHRHAGRPGRRADRRGGLPLSVRAPRARATWRRPFTSRTPRAP